MNSPFIPLRKADAAQRLVFGRIDETPDRAGEVFDYASSKPHFLAWSAAMHKASGGRSYGNVRAMHGNVAAGRLRDIGFDDSDHAIELVAHIVDDEEWRKVEEGVYTGFSPGGRYLQRWADGALTRYTAQPSEVSLVDLPCIPSATFTLVKIDGMAEVRGFRKPVAANGPAALIKEGRRHSAVDLAHVQHIHDTALALGASCADQDPDQDLPLDADKGQRISGWAKLAGEVTEMRGELAKLAGERDALARRVAELEARPRSGGPALRAIAKGEDILPGGGGPEDELAKVRAMPDGLEKSLALIKLAHRHPVAVRY